MAKVKRYVLTKAMDAVFARNDEQSMTFGPEDVGLEFSDDDPAVAKAVALYPGNFRAT